jgi:hypothetical protein
MRQSQTGRAMLDAALVRIALAEQFSSIDQLLAGSAIADKGKAAPAPSRDQKKKPEPEPIDLRAGIFPSPGNPGEGQGEGIRDYSSRSDRSDSFKPSPQPSPGVPGEGEKAAPILATTGDHDLWPRLLALPQTQTPASFASILRVAQYDGIEDDQATLRFPHSHETFVKQWSSNGKRDIIAAALTELRGKPTGVKFEIDVGSELQTPATPSAPAPRPAITDTGPIVEFVLQEFGGTLTRVE